MTKYRSFSVARGRADAGSNCWSSRARGYNIYAVVNDRQYQSHQTGAGMHDIEPSTSDLCWSINKVFIVPFQAAFSCGIFSARRHAERAICYRPSVRLSVTLVDQSKTVEVRIMQFSPYSSPIPLVFTV